MSGAEERAGALMEEAERRLALGESGMWVDIAELLGGSGRETLRKTFESAVSTLEGKDPRTIAGDPDVVVRCGEYGDGIQFSVPRADQPGIGSMVRVTVEWEAVRDDRAGVAPRQAPAVPAPEEDALPHRAEYARSARPVGADEGRDGRAHMRGQGGASRSEERGASEVGGSVDLGSVRVFDRPDWPQDSKQQVLKVLEEAAEVFGSWQLYDRSRHMHDGSRASHHVDLADECADVIQSTVNLAHACDIDLREALDRCEYHNRERGRLS